MLGAGGAARAAVWALREAGAEVTVWNRTAERAAALASELGVAASERPGPSELLVNATSVGLHAHDSLEGLPLVDARVVSTWCTATRPRRSPAGPRSAAPASIDGLEVLVCQGARSLAVWTGREPPVDAMRRAVVQSSSSTSAQV